MFCLVNSVSKGIVRTQSCYNLYNKKMDTLIVPGFSLKNKDWSEEVQRNLMPINSRIHYWSHWETGQAEDSWVGKETKEIISHENLIINIIAKSIGTLVAMKILKLKLKLINRIILCGIPLNDFHPGDKEFYEALKLLDEKNILCIQNENDNHGTFFDVEKFVHAINPNIKIISKPRSDHEYPYFEDFAVFLKN